MAINYNERIPNNVNLSDNRRLQRALEAWQPKFLDWWKELGPEGIAPVCLLSGRDLIQLGFQPSPQFTIILDAVEEAQLEGQVRTREDAVSWVQQHWQPETQD